MTISSLLRRPRHEAHVRLDAERIDRYWRHAHGGDAGLDRYEQARILSSSNDNFFKQNRFFTLAQMVARVLDGHIDGDVVECGCFRGHSTYLVAERLHAARWGRTFFVFDSFEGGLSDRVGQDRIGLPEEVSSQTFASSFVDVRRLLEPFPFVSLQKGWIPDVFRTVPDLVDRRFALVHLDVDLYEPTRYSLACFGPRMSEGGVIVVDDYGSASFPGCRTAVDEFCAATPPRFFIEGHLMGAVLLF